MTWQAAQKYCLRQDSRLASWTDVQVINENSSFLNDGRLCWINSAQSKVYPLQHPSLQHWYWLDSKEFNASHRRGLYEKLSYNGEEERCAIIRDSKNGIWEDSLCSVGHSLVCKKREVIEDKVYCLHF